MEYCRSNLGDKISDYEDLWTQENNSRSSLHIALDQNNSSNGNITSKECEITSPMVISPPQQFTPSSSVSPALIGSEIAITTTPIQPKTPLLFDGNKKSPFYSDPVDAVVPVFPQIIRREPKLNPLPSFHRYSEPPKGQFEDINFHISSTSSSLMPSQHEKGIQQQSFIAASLDHLKSINKPINNRHQRLDPTWTVDSSWEFVDKNDESSENGSTRNVRQITPQNTLSYQNSNNKHQVQQKFNNNNNNSNTIERNNQCAMSVDSYLMNSKKFNIYKMVAKKYPEINLKGGITIQSNIPSTWQTFDSDCSNKFQRLSSYDNVIEQQSIYGGSEDGTLFSEPWDSSQWDSFFPTTEGKNSYLFIFLSSHICNFIEWHFLPFLLHFHKQLIDSSTIHLSKCRPAISEDETIIEDSSAISRSNANTIQRNPLLHSHKVATVLRHRSGCYKDREILSEY